MKAPFVQTIHQCKDCIYSYKPESGDPTQGIKPGVPFEELPANWVCPICRSSKNRFRPV